MEKPGVEYYDMALFVVTILSKHGSPTSAGNAISKNINKTTILTPQQVEKMIDDKIKLL